MLKKFLVPIMAILLLASTLSAADPQTTAAHKWEYIVITHLTIGKNMMWGGKGFDEKKITDKTGIPDALNILGAEGWELVAIETDGSSPKSVTYYFKR